jgi:hypothetical protein
MFAAHCLPPLGKGDRQTKMSAEHDPGEGRPGSSSGDLGDMPAWEDAPARSSREDAPPRAGSREDAPARAGSREDAPARAAGGEDAPATEPPVERSPAADPDELSPAEARSRARQERSRARQEGRRRADSPNMLPGRRGRPLIERLLVRLIATFGIVAIGVAIAAIMVSSHSEGWLTGLVVSGVSVVLAAILWSSRTL